MLKGNKGEWSEIYALLKTLSDKQLYAGDQNLNKIKKLLTDIALGMTPSKVWTGELDATGVIWS